MKPIQLSTPEIEDFLRGMSDMSGDFWRPPPDSAKTDMIIRILADIRELLRDKK